MVIRLTQMGQIMKNKSYILIFLVALLTFGCATTVKMISGEKRPREEVAIITGSTYYWVLALCDVTISSVDSIPTEYYSKETAAVLPGRHTVIAHYKCYWPGGGGIGLGESTIGQFKLVFDVEAGHKYKMKLKSRWGKASLLVVDTKSGMMVGSSD